MRSLHEMSYEEFGRLRFLDFFPKTELYSIREANEFERREGIASLEGYIDTYFIRGDDLGTLSIDLNFKEDCPETAGNSLLERLGLGLRKNMADFDLRAKLGFPNLDTGLFWRFVIGGGSPFNLTCFITAPQRGITSGPGFQFGTSSESGLWRVVIARKDWADLLDSDEF